MSAIDINYAVVTCKMGQRADCCKYLVGGPKGMECAKLGVFRSIIDARTDMVAKGDNCDGK